MAGAKLLDLKIQKCAWVTTIADPSAPTATEIDAGKDLSCLLTPNYSVDFADADTVSERALCETFGTISFTVDHYEGQLEMFRQFTTLGVADTTDPLSIFAPNTHPIGWFVRRVGPLQSVAWTAADKVELWKFAADNPKTKGGTNEGYLKCSVKLVEQGAVYFTTIAS